MSGAAEMVVGSGDDRNCAPIERFTVVPVQDHALQAELQTERRRANENAKLADILQSVVRATRELAEELDFEVGINRWLQTLGENTDAARASIYDTIGTQGGPDQSLRALAEWVRPGVEHSIEVSFASPVVMPVDHASELWTAVVTNKPFVVTLANTDPQMCAFLEAQGNKAVLCVPFLVAGRTWAVSFDFQFERDFDARTLATLQTAANSIATEIQRRDAEAAKLAAEREQVKAAEASAQALARKRDLLAAVVTASDGLLAAIGLDEAADSTCAMLGKALGADRFVIGHFLPPDSKSEVGYCFWSHEWTSPGTARQTEDPELRKLDMTDYFDIYSRLSRREPTSIATTDLISSQAQQEQSSTGSLSQFIYPVFVDDELWGAIGADDCQKPRIWDESEVATFSLVASAISATVKRERLMQARIDAERALLDERNRIAREIHDTLAQGLTGVIMQSQAAEDALKKDDPDAVVGHLGRARAIAASSLRAARRSVFALLPSVLAGRTLASALARQLETMAAGTSVLAKFEEVGPPNAASNLVATEFIRIGQEATTNVLRHAKARTIQIKLKWDDDLVALSIVDDGLGFNPSLNQTGFGLVSIRERAWRMGAELTIDSKPGGGTLIRVVALAAQSLTAGATR
jgi:signal transduction histidine kinase